MGLADGVRIGEVGGMTGNGEDEQQLQHEHAQQQLQHELSRSLHGHDLVNGHHQQQQQQQQQQPPPLQQQHQQQQQDHVGGPLPSLWDLSSDMMGAGAGVGTSVDGRGRLEEQPYRGFGRSGGVVYAPGQAGMTYR